MKYIIGSEVQEPESKKTGKRFKKFSVKDEKGVVTREVAAFSFFSGYNDIKPGATVEAVLKEGEFNGQKSYSLVDGNLGPKPSGFAKEAVADKAKNIEKAQDRKEEGIMISSTMRMAVDLSVAQIEAKGLTPSIEEMKKQILLWRKWLMNNWDPQEKEELTSHGDPVPDFKVEIDASEIPF